MKALKANLKQKFLLIGLLFIYSNMSGQSLIPSWINMYSLLNSNIHYTIQNPPTNDGIQTTFSFSGNGLKDILRGQAYFVISKSEKINNIKDCFRNTITNRFYPGNPTRSKRFMREDFLNFKGVCQVNTIESYIKIHGYN